MASPLQSDYEKIVKQSAKLAASLDRANRKEYAGILKSLRAELANVYAKYADADGRLSYAEMQKYDRLKNLKSSIDEIVKEGASTANSATTSALRGQISNTFGESMDIIGGAAATTLEGKLKAEAITAILQKPVEGWTLTERLALRTRDLAVRINAATINGFVHQNTYSESAKVIKGVTEKGYGRVKALVSDETHRVTQDTVKESVISASDKGIETVKVWVTAGDSSVRDAHALLDGQTVRGDQNFVIPSGPWKGYQADAPEGFGEPALDYNCRCWLVADVRTKEE